MAPVKTAVILPGGVRIDLIIPIGSGTTLQALQDLAVERAARHHTATIFPGEDILLRLENETGPFLYTNDKVEDVVSTGDTVFVILGPSLISGSPPQSEPFVTTTRSADDFQLRVITPYLAHCHEDIRTIPLLGSGKVFSANTTLLELREVIASSLDISLRPEFSQLQECNCSMANMSSGMPHLSTEGSSKILVVSGLSKFAWVDILEPTYGSIMAGLKQSLGEDFEDTKSVHLKGGGQTVGDAFTRLPVVSVCAKSRHSNLPPITTASPAAISMLDLHTAEGPIETSCLNFSIEKLGLTDLVVNGVLSIYAVERRSDSTTIARQILGKDALFSTANHWELPRMTSSPRGSNAFLSSLRVFVDRINAEKMDTGCQNVVLKLVHELTRYFPAVRALRVLMNGKTLRPNECATIVQTFAEAIRDLVPRNLIVNDERRYLEGTRLLLAVILQKAEKLSKKTPGSPGKSAEDKLPYLNLFKTIDCRDMRTNDTIIDPVQTDLGLMEKGCFDAFKPGGALSHSGRGNIDVSSDNADLPMLRAAVLNGGVAPESSYYDTDAVQACLSNSNVSDDLIKELRDHSKDLSYLGMLCHKTSIPVIHPTALKSASAPALTLDRDGYLCVYVGRAACAPPDLNISVFSPLKGREEAIDVNIVAQLIEPIIRSREQDGTAVFDLFSSSVPVKNSEPTELLMFCVDCSASMDEGSDFQEIHETPEIPTSGEATMDDLPATEEADDPTSLEEIRTWLSEHESFEDMVAIVASANTWTGRAIASELVDFVSLLTSRELIEKTKQFAKMSSWATRGFLSDAGTSLVLQAGSLRRLVMGLNIYKSALCDFLIFKAQSWTDSGCITWTYGGPIPQTAVVSPAAHGLDVTEYPSIPPEIICPISQTVFEDPVTTADNFTYERLSIERWFQIRQSSPLTGLPLQDSSLKRHQPLHDQAKRWVSGEDILQAAPPARKRSRLPNTRSAVELHLNFVTPTGTFSRKVPPTLTLTDLYQLAYRGMRGAHKTFSLHSHGSMLESSDQQLGSRRIASGSDIVASIQPALQSASVPLENSSEGMCLIKVYKSMAEIFSYWIPQDTSHTMASIIFRFWRFYPLDGRSFSKDQQVWSDLQHSGDGHRLGKRHKHWDLLAETLNKLDIRKLVPDEELCANSSFQDEIEPPRQDPPSDGDDTTKNNALSMTMEAHYRVFKVELDSYRSPEAIELERREKLRSLTRLAVSKQVFGAFINRLIAYNYPTMVGLVSFGSSTSIAQPLTATIENFRHAIDRLEASGDTSLWDALALAADQLAHLGERWPGIKKRIICLSDGVDTKSVAAPTVVCRRLVRSMIVLDSCSIGMEDNSDLRTISFLTGGYKFVPKTLEQAVAICELEPVLSIHERPAIVLPITSPLPTRNSFALAATRATPNEATQDDFPLRKSHPNLHDQFVRIDTVERRPRNTIPPLLNAVRVDRSTLRQRRLQNEIQNIAGDPHPSYDVYVSESNMGFWKVVLSGPSESAYASGTFVLYLDMGDDYPQSPPKARFITRIFHPNINLGGKICHSILARNYTVDITNKQILDTVFGLLLVPEFTDPINTVVTLNFYWDEVAFREEVKKHIGKYALKGREELGKEILGE